MEFKIVEHTQQNNVDIISVLEKRIFLDLTEKFKDEVIHIFEKGAKNIIFDLGNVNVMNSSGLGVLILARDKIEKKGGKIVICGLLPLMKEIFDRMQFSSFFTVVDDLEEALLAIGQG